MRASELLIAHRSVDNGTLVITAKGTSQIMVIGASIPLSVAPGARVNQFSVVPEEGKDGMVAIAIYGDRQTGKHWIEFMLSVSWKSDLPLIDLEDTWQPSHDRLGQVNDLNMEVLINDVWFTTDACLFTRKEECRARHLPDANLICQYLVGNATAEEVLQAATEHAEEACAKEQLKIVQRQRDEALVEVARLKGLVTITTN